MKSYLVIIIRISIINFVVILFSVVYFASKPLVAGSKNSLKNTPTAQPTEIALAPSPSTDVSPSAQEEPTVTPNPTATVLFTRTPSATPNVTGSSVTSTPTSTPRPATAAPTATQAPTTTPTPAPTVQPTATPAPTAPPNPLLVRVAPHNTETDCWMVIDSHIYNVSDYMRLHPGGKDPLIKYCGKDGTTGYHTKDLNPPVEHTANSNAMLDLFIVE